MQLPVRLDLKVPMRFAERLKDVLASRRAYTASGSVSGLANTAKAVSI
jgi:hypothetical protein